MSATLFVIPGSHPAMAARLMLEHKGIDYRRVDLTPVLARPLLRLAGFPGVTVPALKLDGASIQGTGRIARALDDAAPAPPLLPADPERRAEIEAAERWADEVLQPIPRRIVWNVMGRDRSVGRSYLEGARLGLPVAVAAKTATPITYLAKRLNGADDEAVRADLEALPEALDHADSLLAAGVIGAEQPNVADFQIATSVRLLLTVEDLRPAFEGRPCAAHAMGLAPIYPGYAPATMPERWTSPLLNSAPRGERSSST